MARMEAIFKFSPTLRNLYNAETAFHIKVMGAGSFYFILVLGLFYKSKQTYWLVIQI